LGWVLEESKITIIASRREEKKNYAKFSGASIVARSSVYQPVADHGAGTLGGMFAGFCGAREGMMMMMMMIVIVIVMTIMIMIMIVVVVEGKLVGCFSSYNLSLFYSLPFL
jgi:hypothetical protein